MNRKTKREALQILMTWRPEVVAASLASPTPYMPPVMLALHRIALRKMGAVL